MGMAILSESNFLPIKMELRIEGQWYSSKTKQRLQSLSQWMGNGSRDNKYMLRTGGLKSLKEPDLVRKLMIKCLVLAIC